MEKLLKRVYSSKKIAVSLKIISHASVVLCVVSFAALLVYFYLREPLSAVKLLCTAGVPYMLVSIARRIINAPRPYELYEFYEVKPKQKRGQSFPSRHVFSSCVVAALAGMVSIWFSIALFAVGISLAIARVLLGMHFIRDVLAGAVIGALSAIIGIIIVF